MIPEVWFIPEAEPPAQKLPPASGAVGTTGDGIVPGIISSFFYSYIE